MSRGNTAQEQVEKLQESLKMMTCRSQLCLSLPTEVDYHEEGRLSLSRSVFPGHQKCVKQSLNQHLERIGLFYN